MSKSRPRMWSVQIASTGEIRECASLLTLLRSFVPPIVPWSVRSRWRRFMSVNCTTGGKNCFASPTRFELIRAAFTRPGKDVWL